MHECLLSLIVLPEWTPEEFEELIHKTFKDVVSVDLAMASNHGSSSKRHINRGFAFVRFSSHSVLGYWPILLPLVLFFNKKVCLDKQSSANTRICAKLPSIYPPKILLLLLDDILHFVAVP